MSDTVERVHQSCERVGGVKSVLKSCGPLRTYAQSLHLQYFLTWGATLRPRVSTVKKSQIHTAPCKCGPPPHDQVPLPEPSLPPEAATLALSLLRLLRLAHVAAP